MAARANAYVAVRTDGPGGRIDRRHERIACALPGAHGRPARLRGISPSRSAGHRFRRAARPFAVRHGHRYWSEMFERYTERARRILFFARYEASEFGALSIEAEHILLGLLREDAG